MNLLKLMDVTLIMYTIAMLLQLFKDHRGR